MPSGWTNVCDDEDFVTKPEVLHAEENAITKLARSSAMFKYDFENTYNIDTYKRIYMNAHTHGNESGEGATAFITHVPCLSCAKLLYSSGIVEVYYTHPYKNTEGLDFLNECKIEVNEYADN